MTGMWGSQYREPHGWMTTSAGNRRSGWTAIDAMQGPEFTGGIEVLAVFGRLLSALPWKVSLAIGAAVLLGLMAGCTAAAFSGPHYGPSVEVCDPVVRTNCIPPDRLPVSPPPGVAGVRL